MFDIQFKLTLLPAVVGVVPTAIGLAATLPEGDVTPALIRHGIIETEIDRVTRKIGAA